MKILRTLSYLAKVRLGVSEMAVYDPTLSCLTGHLHQTDFQDLKSSIILKAKPEKKMLLCHEYTRITNLTFSTYPLYFNYYGTVLLRFEKLTEVTGKTVI